MRRHRAGGWMICIFAGAWDNSITVTAGRHVIASNPCRDRRPLSRQGQTPADLRLAVADGNGCSVRQPFPSCALLHWQIAVRVPNEEREEPLRTARSDIDDERFLPASGAFLCQ
jgi:hypothetical protein